jgi:uncharacterized membrane protein
MLSEVRLKNWLGIILQVSMLISIAFVLFGGLCFLWEHGHKDLQQFLSTPTHYNINILTIWRDQSFFSPIALIEVGLLVLVIAQILRVALMTGYYILIRDLWFTLFSFFILSVILYSLIWQ